MIKMNESWNDYQKSLFWDNMGDWDKAHDLIQDLDTTEAAWIHAYLHRKEGDNWNARYWYNQANKPFFEGSLEQEWVSLWDYFNSEVS